MREILTDLENWKSQGKDAAVATLVKAYGSSPRGLAAKMAVSSSGDVIGSVSGGCVEGAVVEKAQEVMETGEPALLNFGITDEEAWSVGLSCGGEIEVFVEPVRFDD